MENEALNIVYGSRSGHFIKFVHGMRVQFHIFATSFTHPNLQNKLKEHNNERITTFKQKRVTRVNQKNG